MSVSVDYAKDYVNYAKDCTVEDGILIRKLDFKDIRILNTYLSHPPHVKKFEDCVSFLETNGYIDKPIVVNEDNVLVDGFCRLLALAEKCKTGALPNDGIVVKVINQKISIDKRTIPFDNIPYRYVTTVFERQPNKEYVWKIPYKLINTPIQQGDRCYVKNKDQRSVIEVKSVFTSYSPEHWKHKYVVQILPRESNNSKLSVSAKSVSVKSHISEAELRDTVTSAAPKSALDSRRIMKARKAFNKLNENKIESEDI